MTMELAAQMGDDLFLVSTSPDDAVFPMGYQVDWGEKKLVGGEVNLLVMLKMGNGYWEDPSVSEEVKKEILDFVANVVANLAGVS